jgi:carboxylesterase type B
MPVDLNVNDNKIALAANQIKKFYFGNNLIAFSDRKLMKFLSDDLFVRPIREYVRQVSKYVPVYFYRFSYEGALWGLQNRTQPGVAHSEELGYIWRSKFTPSQRDILTRKRMTSMWTDFAKFGNPTPKKYFTTSEVIWKRTDENFTYLDIEDELYLRQLPEKSNMALWDEIYQVYGNRPFDTY